MLHVNLLRFQHWPAVHARVTPHLNESVAGLETHKPPLGLAGRVKLQLEGQRVTVSGTVTRWAEKDAVVALLMHAPGVRSVVDHLVVQGPA
jgi:BON domain